MTQLWPIVILSLMMALLSQRNSVQDSVTKEYIVKDRFWFTIMTIAMVLFVGLRTRYNDTRTYVRAYELMMQYSNPFDSISWSIGDNFGFKFVDACMITLGVSSQSFLMIYALVTVAIYVWFIRKYTENIPMSIFLLIMDGGYLFALAAIKQCIAIAFCLIATDRAIEKKWGSFVIWILIAMTFHPYSFLYLVIPLLRFKPWTNKTYILILAAAVGGVSLQAMLGGIISMTSMMGETYTVSEMSGEGVNIFRVAVCWVPVVLSFCVRNRIQNEDNPIQEIMLNLSMIRSVIMFIALFGTANYFARLANYFAIFPCFSIPWLISKFDFRDNKRVLTILAVICYLIYFIYENAFSQPFDDLYSRVSLGEYVLSLFQ